MTSLTKEDHINDIRQWKIEHEKLFEETVSRIRSQEEAFWYVLKQEIEAFRKFDGDAEGYYKKLMGIKKFVHQHHLDLEALLVSPHEEGERKK